MKKANRQTSRIQDLVIEKRKKLKVTQKQMGQILGLGKSGERSVRRWENGEHQPSDNQCEQIKALQMHAPFYDGDKEGSFRFIDLFAGIGGIRLPFQETGGRCVFSSEWDRFSQVTYTRNFGHPPHGDITKIPTQDIPDHDVLLAGFPCQAFSQAGLKQGFQDTRGTMFFEIQRILAEKRPKAFLLENVKQLRGHDGGRTLQTILDILRGEHFTKIPKNVPMSEDARKGLDTKLDYWVDYRVLRAGDFGVPQNRERIYIIGFDRSAFPGVDFDKCFKWPEPTGEKTKLGWILDDNDKVDPKYTLSNKLWAGHKRRKREHEKKGNGFGYSLFTPESAYSNTISARYYKDGSEILIDQSDIGKNPRKLTPRECARLQGFPEEFIVNEVSDAQAYRQFGNSVSIPVIRLLARAMTTVLALAEQKKKRKANG